MTSLTLLLSGDVIKSNTTYGCTIGYVDGRKKLQVAEYKLDVNLAGSIIVENNFSIVDNMSLCALCTALYW